MDILIKGLDLTEGACAINLTICSNGKVYGSQQVGDSMVRINTKAVALPSHGRLISDTDVKALLRSGLSLDSDSDMDYVCGLIDGLTTIVEATE